MDTLVIAEAVGLTLLAFWAGVLIWQILAGTLDACWFRHQAKNYTWPCKVLEDEEEGTGTKIQSRCLVGADSVPDARGRYWECENCSRCDSQGYCWSPPSQ